MTVFTANICVDGLLYCIYHILASQGRFPKHFSILSIFVVKSSDVKIFVLHLYSCCFSVHQLHFCLDPISNYYNVHTAKYREMTPARHQRCYNNNFKLSRQHSQTRRLNLANATEVTRFYVSTLSRFLAGGGRRPPSTRLGSIISQTTETDEQMSSLMYK